MRSIDLIILGASAVSAGTIRARDQTISGTTRNPAYNAGFGRSGELTTVNPGATYWLSGGSTHNFVGNLNNYGTIVVSQTDYLKTNPNAGGQTSNYLANGATGGNVNNYAGGFISLNDYGSASAPSYYWNLQSLSNFGGIQFCGRGDTGGSTYWLTSRQSSTNNGLIDFGQYNANKGAAFYWRNYVAGDSTTLNNEGTVRLSNVVFHNTQNIYGSGCWVLNSGSVLYLEDGTGVVKNPTRGPAFPGQKIYFAQSDSTVRMDTAVYSGVSNFGADVYGFGSGKALEFYQTVQSYSYANGVLTVKFTGNSVNIKIGTGYAPSLFRLGRNTEPYGTTNAIFYDGPAPAQSVPAVCSVARQTCANPETTVGVTTTSASSTTTTAVSSTTTVPTTTTTTTTPSPTTTTTTTTTPAPTTTTTTTSAPTTTTTTTPAPTATDAPTTTTTTPAPSTTTTTDAPTTTSVASSTTTATPVPTCGVSGYDKQSPAAYAVQSIDGASYSVCRDYCASQTQQTSLSFAAGNNYCLCYSAPVQGNLNADPSSPYYFYDNSCPPPAGSSTTTVAPTTTAQPTTTTTTTSTTTASPTGICANGAGPSSTYTAANGDLYGVCRGSDFPAGDLSNVRDIQTVEACAEQCSQTAGCICATLHLESHICYMKKDRNGANANSGDDSVYKISSA